MVFAPTAASIGWQVRGDTVAQSQSSSSSSSRSNHQEQTIIGVVKSRGKEKSKRKDAFQTERQRSTTTSTTPSKKTKRTVVLVPSNNYYGPPHHEPLEEDDTILTPGIRITEKQTTDDEQNSTNCRHSVIVTFDNRTSKHEQSHSQSRQCGTNPCWDQSMSVAVIGTAEVMVLRGSVTIFGYTLTAADDDANHPSVATAADSSSQQTKRRSSSLVLLNSPSWMSSFCITPSCITNDVDDGNNSRTSSVIGISSSNPQPQSQQQSQQQQTSPTTTQIKITSTSSAINNEEGNPISTFQLTTTDKVRAPLVISNRWECTATSILKDVTHYQCSGNVTNDDDVMMKMKQKTITTAEDVCRGGKKDDTNSALNQGCDPKIDVVAARSSGDGSSSRIRSKESNIQTNITTHNRNRILVCGAKGVGKSTYLRYQVNRFLSAQEAAKTKAEANDIRCTNEPTFDGSNTTPNNHRIRGVAILDCDVGQPELSPPGLLSLTIVTKPILSPPDAHIVCGGNGIGGTGNGGGGIAHDGEMKEQGGRLFDVADHHCKAYYYGHTSSKADPTSYITAVKKLITDFQTLCDSDGAGDCRDCSGCCDSRMTLLINTDGWVKSMGYEILSSIIDITDPGHIVQIVGSSKAKYFELLSHVTKSRNIHTIEAFGHQHQQHRMGGSTTNRDVLSSPMVLTDTSTTSHYDSPSFVTNTTELFKDNHSPSPVVTSATLRNLNLCTYFLGGCSSFTKIGATFQTTIVDEDHTISSTLARSVPFAVPFDAVDCTHLDGDDDDGGGGDSSRTMYDSLNCTIVGLCVGTRTSSRRASYPCVGLGIIRGINWRKRLFYILTPVPAHKLIGRVQTLVGGHIQLPIECVFLGVKSESFSFQCCDGISVGIGNNNNNAAANSS